MKLKEAAIKYYWEHTELHEASESQHWLKDVVVACFQDGARWAYEDAARIASGQKQQNLDAAQIAEEAGRKGVASHRYSDADTADFILECIEGRMSEGDEWTTRNSK